MRSIETTAGKVFKYYDLSSDTAIIQEFDKGNYSIIPDRIVIKETGEIILY
jgi:hypothetical protein